MNVLGSRRGQRNIGDNICQTIRIAREKQDHKKPFIIWQTGLLVEKKKGEAWCSDALDHHYGATTGTSDSWQHNAETRILQLLWGPLVCRNMLCVSVCVCACVVSCLLLDLKRDWLSAVQSCHLGTPSSRPASTPTLINCCCYANFIRMHKKTPERKKEMVADGVTWEQKSAFQVQTSRIEMRRLSLLFCVNCYFNPERHRHTCGG